MGSGGAHLHGRLVRPHAPQLVLQQRDLVARDLQAGGLLRVRGVGGGHGAAPVEGLRGAVRRLPLRLDQLRGAHPRVLQHTRQLLPVRRLPRPRLLQRSVRRLSG